MIIGVPKEIKNHEYRVGLTPSSVKELTSAGHKVIVETNAGTGIDFSDAAYIDSGAQIAANASEVFSIAKMIIKVKEPQVEERTKLNEDHILFTYLHLAADPKQAADLIKSKACCIAYETITDVNAQLPLLTPMSEVAGRMSIQAGAYSLEKKQGGCGILLSGVPGVAPANIVIIGGGIVGSHAAQMAIGLGAKVTILDNNLDSLRKLNRQFGTTATLLHSNKTSLQESVLNADLVIGAVLIPGAAAPKLVTKDMISSMKAGSAIVDVAIDQGGCFETSKATTHDKPTYIVDDIVHYCVANMPGGVAKTAAQSLNNATLPYVMTLANKGWEKALKEDKHFLQGLNACNGHITNKAVSSALDYEFVNPSLLLG